MTITERLEEIVKQLREIDVNDYVINDYLYDALEALRKAINAINTGARK